ncbi:MAG: lectin-like protein [Bacteroidota bacterium]
MIGIYKKQVLKQLLLVNLFLVAFAALAFGQSVWTGNVDSDWDNPANWSAGVPVSGSTATVPGTTSGGNFPTYSGAPILDFTIQNGGTITFDVVIYNAGAVINFASGSIVSNNLFINAGLVTFDNDGAFDNNGAFENYGLFDNAASAVLNNNQGASFFNFNELRNTGLINNRGEFNNLGELRNTGTFQNYGTLTHFGSFENTQGSSFVNNAGAVFHPEAGSDFMLNGLLTNDAEVMIDGRLLINVAGTLNNNGRLTNAKTLEIAGSLDNNGDITNNDLLLINDSGTLTNNNNLDNSGTIDISVCGTLIQQSGGTVGGTVINEGIVYSIQGNVNVTSGELGVVLNDLNDRKPPVAGCRPGAFVELDANGEATLPVNLVDRGSFGQCGAALTSVTVAPDQFTTADLGQQVVTLTVEDEFGFVSTCEAIVTVLPFQPPVTAVDDNDIDSTCPDDITVVGLPGAAAASASWTEPTATSNCQPTVIDCSSTPNEIPGLIFLGEFNNSKYYCSPSNDLTWHEARNLATSKGGFLATINDAAENAFVAARILNHDVWIGYNDEANEGHFVWDNGEDPGYTNWRSGEPTGGNEDYARLVKDSGKWTDRNEHYRSEALIEVPCQAVLDCRSQTENIAGFIYLGEFNNSKYFCSNGNDFTWRQARDLVAANGGHLAVINDAQENEYLRTRILNHDAWIGYTDEANEGHFVWVTGDNPGYTNWRSGEPNNNGGDEHYARLLKDSGKWTDRDAHYKSEVLMEIPCGGGTAKTCELANHGPSSNGVGERLVWINFDNESENREYTVEGSGVSFQEFADGSALISGTIADVKRPNRRWEISVKLINKRTWAQWSALGRSFKSGAGDHTQWFYYEVDNNNSTFTGLGSNAGKVLNITHDPADYEFGFQVGFGANLKDSDFGLSGWYGISGSKHGKGDFNGDLRNCVPTTGGSGEVTIEQIRGLPSGSDFPVGTTTIAYRISDDCGNEEICTFEVIVEETPSEISLLTCPADIVVNTLPGDDKAIATWDEPTGTTTCFRGGLEALQTLGKESGSEFEVGTSTIAYSLIDSCGNFVPCVFTITVVAVDAELLVTSCPQDIQTDNPQVTYAMPSGTTDCFRGFLEIKRLTGPASGETFPIGVTPVVFLLADECGNTEICSFTVTVDPPCPDADADGVCDVDDVCPGFDDNADEDGDGTPDGCDDCNNNLAGTPCDDNNDCTVNDVFDANCNCAGTFQDSDGDGVCDAEDICAGFDDTADADGDGTPDGCDDCDANQAGMPCDDNDDCTTNDVLDADCNCAGTFQDSDGDGVCDAEDNCPGFDDNADADGDGIADGCDDCDANQAGMPCDDNDDCTSNDVLDADCNCAGTFQDSDGDGVCDAEDNCPGFDDNADADGDGTPDGCDDCDANLAGTPCDDNDECTVNDIFDANCNCAGTFKDGDKDDVCDADDICPGFDDNADADGDGIPDGCDVCAGFDDNVDTDGDGIPDGCDDCDANLAGTPCDDNDDCTVNDVFDANCNCAGTFQDSDNDGVCDADEPCISYRIEDSRPVCAPFTSYESGVFYRRNCGSTFEVWKAGDDLVLTENNDGTAQITGTVINNGTVGTVNIDLGGFAATGRSWMNNCYLSTLHPDYYYTSFNGTISIGSETFTLIQKSNGSDFVLGQGANNELDDDFSVGAWLDGTWGNCVEMFGNLIPIQPGDSCDDGDDCTSNDAYDDNCNCAGTFEDSDNDGICDAEDICAGFDDNADADGDGTPDGCDVCDNLTDGGHIGYAQTGCSPYDPNALVSIADPSGGSGALEIIWMQSNVDILPVSIDNDPYWTTIGGANGTTYDPGELTQTTYFIRCSRREGCDNYVGESNIIKITVEDCNNLCQNNLIHNPGFEHGLDGWYIDHPVYATGHEFSGQKAAKIGRYSGGLWQYFSVSEGQILSLKAYSKIRYLDQCRWAGMGLDFYDEWGNYLHSEYIEFNSEEYEQYSLAAVAPQGSNHVNAWFWKSGRGGRLFVDDVCLTISGAGGTGFAYRPVLALNATKEGQSVALHWATNTEFKNDYFIIEHSIDGEHYEPVDQVTSISSGRSAIHYDEIHLTPAQGENFYRIKQVHTNGSFVYTNEEMVLFESDPSQVTVYPNPTSDQVSINLKEYLGKDATIQIYNALGQPVYEARVDEMREPIQTFDVRQYGSGVYSIKVKVDGRPQISRMFVVSRQ